MKRFILGWLVLSIYQVVWAAPIFFMDLNQVDKKIVIPAGQQQFTLALKANPTTGFTWMITGYDHVQVTLISRDYRRTQPYRIGSPGFDYFTFKLKALTTTQQGAIHLRYARPWEKPSAASTGGDTVIHWCYVANSRASVGACK